MKRKTMGIFIGLAVLALLAVSGLEAANYSVQQILNMVLVDDSGAALNANYTDQQALNAVLDNSGTALEIRAASRDVCIAAMDSATTVYTGDGTVGFCVPVGMDGLSLTDALASVYAKGTTGQTDIQIRRVRAGVAADMLSTKVTIGDEFFARDGVIDSTNANVATGDLIFIDVDAVHTTPPTGLSVTLTFR